jgi:hypothetical protein
MAEFTSWCSPEGEASLKSIVASRIPAWTNGLCDRQAQPILRILDGQDLILCTAMGDGKSALFTVPILCHLAVSQAPNQFPKFRAIRRHPVGIVITPTKGLARNIVRSLLARCPVNSDCFTRSKHWLNIMFQHLHTTGKPSCTPQANVGTLGRR